MFGIERIFPTRIDDEKAVHVTTGAKARGPGGASHCRFPLSQPASMLMSINRDDKKLNNHFELNTLKNQKRKTTVEKEGNLKHRNHTR